MQATCKKNKEHQPRRESSEMEEKLEALGVVVVAQRVT